MGRPRSSRSPRPSSGGGGSRPPPSHPAEANPAHRAELGRNLRRNDAELAALSRLNGALRGLRADVVERCGEAALLDVGEGLIRLRTGDLGTRTDPAVVRVVPGVVLGKGKVSAAGEGAGGGSAPPSPAKAGAGADANAKADGDADADAEPITSLPPDEVVLPPGPETDALRSFLLHLNLRTRLLNRLFRRLNRLGRTMDGEAALTPPQIPKYGDVRFVIDDGAYGAFKEDFAKREEARIRLLVRRKEERLREIAGRQSDEEKEDVEMEDSEEMAKEKEGNTDDEKKQPTEEEDLELLMETEVGYDKVVTYQDLTKAKPKPADSADAAEGDAPAAAPTPVDATEGDTPAEAPKSAEGSASAEAPKPTDPVEGSAPAEAPKPQATEAPKSADPADGPVPPEAPKSEEAAAVEKISLIPGKIKKTVAFPLATEESPNEEHADMKYGQNIGAVHRTMNSREREMEFNRWKSDVLARIPDQPTFDELGLEGRVFELEERRKRIAGGTGAATEGAESGEVKGMDIAEDKKGKDSMDMDREEAAAGDGSKTRKDNTESKEKNGEEDEKDEKEGEKKEKTFKQKKLLSLLATPSFHNQDLRRIRLIHADLFQSSVFEAAKANVDQAALDYDIAYKKSTDLHNKKNQCMMHLNKISTDIRRRKTMRPEDQIAVQMYRSHFLRARDDWANRRRAANLVVPPYDDIDHASPEGHKRGTLITNEKVDDPNASDVTKAVALTLGTMVNAVADRAENKWTPMTGVVPVTVSNFPKCFPPFPAPDPLVPALQKQEPILRAQVADFSKKLATAEEDRKKAWSRMIKAKEELRIVTGGSGGQRRVAGRAPAAKPRAPASRGRPASRAPAGRAPVPYPGSAQPGTYGNIPMGYGASTNGTGVGAANPAHHAAAHHAAVQAAMGKKYSKSAIIARTLHDGSIAPTTAPKRGPDGQYLRPTGRGRKGMDWDSRNGRWVPQQNRYG